MPAFDHLPLLINPTHSDAACATLRGAEERYSPQNKPLPRSSTFFETCLQDGGGGGDTPCKTSSRWLPFFHLLASSSIQVVVQPDLFTSPLEVDAAISRSPRDRPHRLLIFREEAFGMTINFSGRTDSDSTRLDSMANLRLTRRACHAYPILGSGISSSAHPLHCQPAAQDVRTNGCTRTYT